MTLYSKTARGFYASEKLSRDLRVAAHASFLSSFLMFISAILFASGFSAEWEGRTKDPMQAHIEEYKALNTTLIKELWADRRRARVPYMLGDGFGVVAWVCMMPGVASLAEVSGGEQRSSTKLLTSAFSVAAIITVVDFTFQAGLVTTADWVSTWPLLSDDAHAHDGGFGALQALELNYLIANSRTNWLFAIDELMLTLGMSAAAYLTHTSKQLSGRWGAFSGVGAFLGFVGFVFHAGRIAPGLWTDMSHGAHVMTALLEMLVLPIWTLWLGTILRALSATPGGAYSRRLSADGTPEQDLRMRAISSEEMAREPRRMPGPADDVSVVVRPNGKGEQVIDAPAAAALPPRGEVRAGVTSTMEPTQRA